MIGPHDVGKRVTLQYYDEDGTRREAVGFFERAEISDGIAILHVRKRDDSLIRVPVNRIRFGKVVGTPGR